MGKLCCDLTVFPHWKSWFIYGKLSPFMAARFRLVKYYNYPDISLDYRCPFPIGWLMKIEGFEETPLTTGK